MAKVGSVQLQQVSRMIIGLLVLMLLSACATRTLSINTGKLEYEQRGQGTPVVLFDAGALSGLNGWDSIWRQLPSNITALRYSRRGEGNSSACVGQLSTADYAADVELLLQARQITTPVIYVSHSLGGSVAREFASRNPGNVSAMLFVDPANPRDVEIIRAVDPANAEAEIAKIKAQDYASGDSELCFLDAFWDKAEAPGVAAIGDIPITLIAGVKRVDNPQRIFDRPQARRLWGEYQAQWVNQFPRGRAIVTDQSGHFVQNDQPELVLDELTNLITIVRGIDPRLAAPADK